MTSSTGGNRSGQVCLRLMLITLLVTIALPVIVVIFHLWLLRGLTWGITRSDNYPRLGIALAILIAIVGHYCEIVIFALGYVILHALDLGDLLGINDYSLDDVIYFSAVTYTSLGYGDITPYGKLQTLATVEALTGILMIAWTGSFTFVQMQARWHLIKSTKAERELKRKLGKKAQNASGQPEKDPARDTDEVATNRNRSVD